MGLEQLGGGIPLPSAHQSPIHNCGAHPVPSLLLPGFIFLAWKSTRTTPGGLGGGGLPQAVQGAPSPPANTKVFPASVSGPSAKRLASLALLGLCCSGEGVCLSGGTSSTQGVGMGKKPWPRNSHGLPACPADTWEHTFSQSSSLTRPPGTTRQPLPGWAHHQLFLQSNM